MSRMFLLCGAAYSGKSTLAEALAAQLGAAVVSLDEINRERNVGFGGEGLPEQVWAEALEIALGRLDRVMRRGLEVVVDDTSCFRWLRDRYRAVASENGHGATLIFFDIPRQEIERRRSRNAITRARGHLTEEVFEQHLSSFESPRDDEPFLKFTVHDQPRDWIDRNLASALEER